MDSDRAVLITGASGQVGRAMRALRPRASFVSKEELDVTDGDAVVAACQGRTTVVHLAAMTDVDKCEREPDTARRVNAEGTASVANAAADVGARVVFVSTDYVFDGRKAGEYTEHDAPSPLSVYGASKVQAETSVLVHEDNLVVRSSTIFGEGNNFVRTMLEAARKTKRLTVVNDQVSRPTAAIDLARALWYLVDAPDASGIVHVAGDGAPCSRAELAIRSLALADIDAKVVPVDTATFLAEVGKPQASRPLNSALSLSRAKQQGIPLFPWIDSLNTYVGGVG